MSKETKAIDWNEALRSSNYNEILTKELLVLFESEIPKFEQEIKQAVNNEDYKTLANVIHKLHGACCYCGLTQLKQHIVGLENRLKTEHNPSVDQDLKQLFTEINSVKQEIKTLI